jgi:flagellar assembly protein FliH
MKDSIALWDMPSVNGRAVQGRRAGRTVSEIEEVERQAYDEAFAKGREAGLASAKAETQQALSQLNTQVKRLEGVLASLSKPLEHVNAEVEQQLLNLTLTVARHLLRRELRADPAQVIAIIRETVSLLPTAARDVRVHMHPEDAAIVRDRLATPTADRAWTIIEDPVMTRGGCRVTTDTAQIDARLETRIHSVMTAMLGDERAAASRGAEESQ